MWQIISAHLQSNCNKIFQLLQNNVIYIHNEGVITFTEKKSFKLTFDETEFKFKEHLNFNDISVELEFVKQGIEIKYSNKKELLTILYLDGNLTSEDCYNSSGVHSYFIHRHHSKPCYFSFNDDELIIISNHHGYESIESYALDELSDFYFDIVDDGFSFKNYDNKFEKICNPNFQNEKLLEGIFIDPYIDEEGKQNFRCIMRNEPFVDEQGNLISLEKREELRRKLNDFEMNYYNYPIQEFIDF